jgi:hypothetical protein
MGPACTYAPHDNLLQGRLRRIPNIGYSEKPFNVSTECLSMNFKMLTVNKKVNGKGNICTERYRKKRTEMLILNPDYS